MGPQTTEATTYPHKKSVVTRIPTSFDTPKADAMSAVAGDGADEANVLGM